MIQNNLSIEFLHTIYDVLEDESISILKSYLDKAIVDDFSISIKSYDVELIKFLEKSKMIYEVIDGVLIVYIAHPNYIKGKNKVLKDFSSFCLSLLKYRVIDEIFSIKNDIYESVDSTLTIEKHLFSDYIREFILQVWIAAFNTNPDIIDDENETVFVYVPNRYVNLIPDNTENVVEVIVDDKQQDI